jgi:hypothetical protein
MRKNAESWAVVSTYVVRTLSRSGGFNQLRRRQPAKTTTTTRTVIVASPEAQTHDHERWTIEDHAATDRVTVAHHRASPARVGLTCVSSAPVPCRPGLD